MKYLFIFIFTLASFLSYAQPTKEEDAICMPTDVAKQIAQDLITGDSAKAVLNLTLDELDLTKEKLSYKDSIIFNDKLKEINLKEQIRIGDQQISNYKLIYEDSKKQYADLAKKYKRLKGKKTFTNILSIIVIGGLSYLYIIK